MGGILGSQAGRTKEWKRLQRKLMWVVVFMVFTMGFLVACIAIMALRNEDTVPNEIVWSGVVLTVVPLLLFGLISYKQLHLARDEDGRTKEGARWSPRERPDNVVALKRSKARSNDG